MAVNSEAGQSGINTLAELFPRLGENDSAVAVIAFGEEDARRTTRAALRDDACALAAGLLARGVHPGDRVAVCGPTSPDWIVVALAVLRAGAVLEPIDAQMENEGLAHVLRDSAPVLMFTDAEHRDILADLGLDQAPEVVLLTDDNGRGPWRDLVGEAPESWHEPTPDDVAILFYTSGTTGAPKGVPLTHRNLAFQINTVLSTEIATERDRLLLALPMHHVYPCVLGLFAPIAVGAALVLPQALTGPQLVRAVRDGEVSVIVGVPRLYRALYEGIQSRLASQGRLVSGLMRGAERLSLFLRRRFGVFAGSWLLRPLHSRFGGRLRLMASGGSALDPDLGWRLEAMGWKVAIGYGLTETAPLLTLRLPGQGPLESVGRVAPGVDVRIDAGAMKREEEGDDTAPRHDSGGSGPDVGEVQARGPGVFGGYLNRPEETERAFTDDKWFRTGDLGYFDEDGYLHITGRLSTMIVTEGGENVQPDDVERAYEQHPLISEIGVLERDRKLVALVVPDPETMSRDAGEAVTEAVQNALRERSAGLPSYMRISTVRVTRNMLPRTRLGKIRRHQLEQRYEEAGQETEERSGVPMSVADMSDQDQALLENRTARQVWDWLCERYPDRALSPDTSPQLDLGVDSMEWLNLTLEIRERTGAEIDERAVERVSTVRDLLSEAAEAGAGAGAGGPAVNPVESPYEVLGEEEQRWLRPLSAPMRLLRWLIYMVGSGILRLFCSITVKGREHLPAEGAFVIAPNHASYLDPFLLGHVLGLASFRKTHWAGATDAAFDTALKRIGCRLGRVVPITPERGAVRALAFAAAVLQKGKRLVWFPEGRRSPDGTLLPLKPGLARVLREIDVPVVPVWLAGTHEAWPVNRRWPRPGALDVVFGKPLSVADLQAAGEGDDPDKQITDGLTRKLRELRDSLA